jgi:hypothetical protein
MTVPIQFIVLKREGKWVVKSKDLERVFSVQREAVDAAIRFANDSGKEGKLRGGAFAKIESQIREDLDIRTEPLSAGQIGFTRGVEDAGAEKIGGCVGLGACALSDRSDTDTREQIRMKAKQSIKGWERSRRADRNFAVATIALMVFFLVAGFTGWMLGTPGAAAVNPPHSDTR